MMAEYHMNLTLCIKGIIIMTALIMPPKEVELILEIIGHDSQLDQAQFRTKFYSHYLN